PIPSGSFATNGLVELLAVAEDEYLAVERSFSVGVGNAIKIFRVNTAGATNIRGGVPAHPQPVAKELLLDLAQLGITLDNIEGITFGPRLPSGELSLILVSDNNFNGFQFTQFLAFAVER
ncbi:MAG: esterase-like activity of phytase family protein, partial [Myxococcota bacterium]